MNTGEGAVQQTPAEAGWESKVVQISGGLDLPEADKAMIRNNPELQKKWVALLDKLEEELLALRKEMLGE